MACFNSIVIDAPIEKVWGKIKNFHDFSWAPNVITNCQPVGDKSGTEVGAKRILNEAFHETLTGFDDNGYRFQYSIDDGPSPISKNDLKNYKADVRLIPVTNEDKTFIEWRSSWESLVEGDEATEFCNPIIQLFWQIWRSNWLNDNCKTNKKPPYGGFLFGKS